MKRVMDCAEVLSDIYYESQKTMKKMYFKSKTLIDASDHERQLLSDISICQVARLMLLDPNYLHRPRYHLVTGAMSGNQGYVEGYTFDRNHLTPKLVANPSAELVKDSKQFIGRKAGNLL